MAFSTVRNMRHRLAAQSIDKYARFRLYMQLSGYATLKLRLRFIALITLVGVFSQIGEFATAYFIVVMGIHTFITLVLRTHHASWFVLSSIVVGWVAAVIIGTWIEVYLVRIQTEVNAAAAPVSVNSATLGPLYGFIVIDCGITRAYPVAHVLLYFIPVSQIAQCRRRDLMAHSALSLLLHLCYHLFSHISCASWQHHREWRSQVPHGRPGRKLALAG